MDNNIDIFTDIMQGLHEIEEYQKGRLALKSTPVKPSEGICYLKQGDIENALPEKSIINALEEVEAVEDDPATWITLEEFWCD
jgi:hypothetical protein